MIKVHFNKKIIENLIYIGTFIALLCSPGLAQSILLDKPVQAGELILFPDVNNPRMYYYLPNKIKLGVNTDGSPQFSFLRYVQNVKTSGSEDTRTEGEGGGIVHTVVQLEVSADQIKDAEKELRRKVTGDSTDQEVVIQGPIIYKSGTMALISSAADETSGFTRKIIGLGPAPIIAGNKAAVSIGLTKQGSKVLWESFKTATPDMSFSFVMTVPGFRSPVNARVEANFDKIYEHHGFKAGLGIGTYIDANIEGAFDELRDSGAIKITGVEASEKMSAIIEITYRKIMDIMFEPIQTNDANPANPASTMNSMVSTLADMAKKSGTSGSSSGSFRLGVAYKMKRVKKTGIFVLDLNKSMTDELQFRFDENFGNINCEKCFRQVNLDDAFYKQREILLSIDGLNSDQFGKYINFVTVSMKKTHGDNKVTLDEARIAQKDFVSNGNLFRLLYGWEDQGDYDRNQWLQYEYKTIWSFFGDYQVVQDWTATDQVGLNLAPPFHPVSISVEANPALMQNGHIRLVTTKFYYDYGAGEKMEQVAIRADDKNMAQKVDFMLKKDQYEYEYEVIWRLSGNKIITTGRHKSTDAILYVDEIPEDLSSH